MKEYMGFGLWISLYMYYYFMCTSLNHPANLLIKEGEDEDELNENDVAEDVWKAIVNGACPCPSTSS